MEFVVNWKTNDPAQSIPLFLKGITFPQGVSVKGSWHYVGKPEGTIVIETSDPAQINVLLANLPAGVFTCDINAAVDDAATKKAFSGHGGH